MGRSGIGRGDGPGPAAPGWRNPAAPGYAGSMEFLNRQAFWPAGHAQPPDRPGPPAGTASARRVPAPADRAARRRVGRDRGAGPCRRCRRAGRRPAAAPARAAAPPRRTLPSRLPGWWCWAAPSTHRRARDRGAPRSTPRRNACSPCAALARAYPDATLVFTGGTGSLRRPEAREAAYARALIAGIGVDPERVPVGCRGPDDAGETRSRALAIADPAPGETWLLVHLRLAYAPRGRQLPRRRVRRGGPYPVDFRAGGGRPLGVRSGGQIWSGWIARPTSGWGSPGTGSRAVTDRLVPEADPNE